MFRIVQDGSALLQQSYLPVRHSLIAIKVGPRQVCLNLRLSVSLFDFKMSHKYSWWFEGPPNKATLDIQYLVGL